MASTASINIKPCDSNSPQSKQFTENDVTVIIEGHSPFVSVATKDFISYYKIKLKRLKKGSKIMVPYLTLDFQERAYR